MKKYVVHAAILAIFTAGMTASVGIVTTSTAAACTAESTRSDQLASSLPQVNYTDRGRHVLALQLALRAQGYDLQGTGNYLTATRVAVKDFQRGHGIQASGIVGSKTWHALVGPLPPGVTGNGRITPPTFGINPGERGEDKLNYLWNTLSRIHPYAEKMVDEGGYGPKTQKLVKDFQRRANIKASGIIGPKTWAAMYEVVAVSGRWGC